MLTFSYAVLPLLNQILPRENFQKGFMWMDVCLFLLRQWQTFVKGWPEAAKHLL